MSYDLVMEIAWKSLLLGVLGLLALRLLGRRSAAERSWIAHAVLIATVGLPLTIAFLPRWEVEAPVFLTAPAASAIADAMPAEAPVTAAAPAAPAPSMIDGETALLALYLGVAGVLLLVTLVAIGRLFALRARASVLVEQSWLSALAHAQRRMGFKHGTALLVSRELASPVSWGILRPIILLNEEALAAHDEAEAIIAHELAHVARLDWAKLLIARIATALFWFNPFVWMLARQCHQLREEAADDAVLRADVDGADYAALLVGAARHESRGMLLAANGVAPGRNSLKRRVGRVLDQGLNRTPARLVWVLGCSLAAIGLSASLSALAPVRASAVETAALGDAPAPVAAPLPVAAPAPRIAPAPAASLPPAPAPATVVAPGVTSPAPPPVAIAVVSSATAAATAPSRLVVNGEPVDRLDDHNPSLARLTPNQLMAIGIHRVRASWLDEMARLGYRNMSYDQVIGLAVHRVTPSYVRELAAAGYANLPVKQITAMRIHGVSGAYVRALKEQGLSGLTVDQMIGMRISGVGAPEHEDDEGG